MQTHCPHCETQFRVTEEQLNIADGYVRCGVCEHVFNAFEVSNKASLEDDHQQPIINDGGSDDHLPATDADIEIKPEVVSDTHLADLEDSENSYIETRADNEPLSVDENIAHTTHKLQENSFDFFNEEVNESLSHVVPEKFRQSHTSTLHTAVSTTLWSIGILLLTASLFVEYIWFNRAQYNHTPELQAVIEKVCQQLDCNRLSMRDPSKIELVARNIYSHPNQKDALMVDITIRNNANFSQPYPAMRISFSDIRGNAVASRHFLPNEYLAKEYKQDNNNKQRLLQPDTNTSLTLEIQDPGKQAKTYEFDFL